jgi:hypothetical protein
MLKNDLHTYSPKKLDRKAEPTQNQLQANKLRSKASHFSPQSLDLNSCGAKMVKFFKEKYFVFGSSFVSTLTERESLCKNSEKASVDVSGCVGGNAESKNV